MRLNHLNMALAFGLLAGGAYVLASRRAPLPQLSAGGLGVNPFLDAFRARQTHGPADLIGSELPPGVPMFSALP